MALLVPEQRVQDVGFNTRGQHEQPQLLLLLATTAATAAASAAASAAADARALQVRLQMQALLLRSA